MKRKLFILALLVMLVAALAITVNAETVASGTCGDNLTWTLDEEGTLTISGTGEMINAPWRSNYTDVIREVVIEDGVTSIYHSAFFDCVNLSSVIIPDGVTSIGHAAFYNCSSLFSVIIPDSVTRIYSYAFYNCSSITSIKIPNGVTNIDEATFYDCCSLTTITIPDGITQIGDYAFRGCSSLVDISIPNSVTSIGNYAFAWCSSLSSIIIPDGVTGIAEGMFWDATNLASITISDSVTSIGPSSFTGCSSITSIIIPNRVTSIGESAFSGCSNLNSVTIGDGVLRINEGAFWLCSSLQHVFYAGTEEQWKSISFSSYNSELKNATRHYNMEGYTEIGCTVKGVYCSLCEKTLIAGDAHSYENGSCTICGEKEPIAIIASGTCGTNLNWTLDAEGTLTISGTGAMSGDAPWDSNRSSIKRVVIGDGVTRIGNSVFMYCSSLTSVTIPDSVTSIGDWAFFSCSNLETITLPEGITQIGESSFSYCSKLSNVTIPESVTVIDSWAFGGCNNLTKITIPTSVTKISNYSFYQCDSLTSIEFYGDAPSFGGYVFGDVTATAYYPPGNETWTEDVMQDYGGDITWVVYCDHIYVNGTCTVCGGEDPDYIPTSGTCGENVTWVLSEDGVLTISGTGVMYDYHYDAPWYGSKDIIKAVVIENGVTGIGECAFATCANLVNVAIADSVTSIGPAAFNNCDSLIEITIPYSVTTIGISAFSASDGLVNMIIPDSVTHIDGSLFNSCAGLRRVVIGNGITEIPGHDFIGCENLEEVIIGENVAYIGYSTFSGCPSLSRVVFRGDAPVFEDEDVFRDISATVYYPVGNTTWTEDVKQNYGGNIIWLVDCEHSYNTVVTAPTCIEVGYTTYTCSVCGDSYNSDEVAALGHSYVDGICTVCGEADPDYIEPFNFRGSSMTLGNTLEINFAVAMADITGDGNYIEISKEYADGSVVTKTYPQAEWTAQGTSVSYVSFRVTAKEMNDKLTVIAYNEKGQQISVTYEDSVAAYCLRKLQDEDKRPTPRAKYRTLYVDMLNYGAAAQTKWGYNTDNLANATLTETQKGYATKITQKDNILEKGVGYRGTSLSLKDNILMNIAFYTSALTDVEYAVVNFISHNNVDKTVTVPIEDFIAQGTTTKYISLECMAVADYAQPVTIDLYNAAGELISATIDSMGSYAGRQTKDTYLYDAILAFGMGAYNYFHS